MESGKQKKTRVIGKQPKQIVKQVKPLKGQEKEKRDSIPYANVKIYDDDDTLPG